MWWEINVSDFMFNIKLNIMIVCVWNIKIQQINIIYCYSIIATNKYCKKKKNNFENSINIIVFCIFLKCLIGSNMKNSKKTHRRRITIQF